MRPHERRAAASRRKPTLEALRALVALADEGAISDAAWRLGVSQPVVTKKLQVFRDAKACVAVLLKSRDGRVVLTEAG